ncbi:MAG: hypothetical protein ABS904_00745 [Solibacillus isronensis]
MDITTISYSSKDYEVIILSPFSDEQEQRGFKDMSFSSDNVAEVINYIDTNKTVKVNGNHVRGSLTIEHEIQVLDRKNNRILEGDAWDIVEYLKAYCTEAV